MDNMKAGGVEWDAWRELCSLLKKSGAVTKNDLETPVSTHSNSPGIKIIQAVKAWGEALVDLRK